VSQKSLNDEERGGNCLLVPERSYGPDNVADRMNWNMSHWTLCRPRSSSRQSVADKCWGSVEDLNPLNKSMSSADSMFHIFLKGKGKGMVLDIAPLTGAQ